MHSLVNCTAHRSKEKKQPQSMNKITNNNNKFGRIMVVFLEKTKPDAPITCDKDTSCMNRCCQDIATTTSKSQFLD